MTTISVSVDGATRKTFESIRRGANFDHLISNLKEFISRRDELGLTRPKLRFGVVMMKSNIHELADIVTLAASLKATDIDFCHVVIYDGLEMESESLSHYKAQSNFELAKAIRRAKSLGVGVVTKPAFFTLNTTSILKKAFRRAKSVGIGIIKKPEYLMHMIPLAFKYSASPFSRSKAAIPYCHFPFHNVSINAGGYVLACPYSHGEAPYGRVTDETAFENIWFNRSFKELRARILNCDPPQMCRRCSFLANRYPNMAAFFSNRTINSFIRFSAI